MTLRSQTAPGRVLAPDEKHILKRAKRGHSCLQTPLPGQSRCDTRLPEPPSQAVPRNSPNAPLQLPRIQL